MSRVRADRLTDRVGTGGGAGAYNPSHGNGSGGQYKVTFNDKY